MRWSPPLTLEVTDLWGVDAAAAAAAAAVVVMRAVGRILNGGDSAVGLTLQSVNPVARHYGQ
jgi:hypothetical protein